MANTTKVNINITNNSNKTKSQPKGRKGKPTGTLMICAYCNGSGKNIIGLICPTCHGKGKVRA